MPECGGVGRTMGSNGRKGGRKAAQAKRPGPKPTAEPPKKQFKEAAKAARIQKMNNAKERRKLDKLLLGDPDGEDQATKDGLQQTVVNARGRSRGFYENCLFLTLFCSLYQEAAVHQDFV
jgi:hypothetical protein